MYSSDEYDSHSESDYSYESNNIDNNLIEDILDLYNEFKERFSTMPFFLSNMKATDLTDITRKCLTNDIDYFVDCIKVDNKLYYKFTNEYKNVLDISFTLYKNTIKRYKRELDYHNWSIICYRYTDKLHLRHVSLLIN